MHLERENASLRETRETLSKAAFGRKSEQQAKPRSARKRGQQRGAKGHGRTPAPVAREDDRGVPAGAGGQRVPQLRHAACRERLP